MGKILIVDDDAHTVAVMALWLRQNGHDIVEARNGVEALERLSNESVDLVVSDVNMPRLNGIEFVKTLREERKLDVPIVMLTSRCDQSALAKQMDVYGIELHPKPFMPSRLVAEIDRLIGAAEAKAH